MADQYGNPTHQTVMTGGQTNQHGNLVPQTGGKGACDVGAGTGMLGGEHQQQHDHQSGVLQRSGSSSSEDDEQGGRRKKGIKDKIKERIPGVGRKDEPCVGRKEEPCVGRKDEQKHTSATTTPGQGQQPKGVMEKIKEKLPGGH